MAHCGRCRKPCPVCCVKQPVSHALQEQHLLALMLVNAYETDSTFASHAALTNSLCTQAVT